MKIFTKNTGMAKKKRTKITLKKQKAKSDFLLAILPLILTTFGVIMIYNASVVEAFRDFQDKFFYFRFQAYWAIIGIVLMVFFSFFPHEFLKKISLPAFIITLLLLITVLIPGVGTSALGARRWLQLGSISIQPSEILKLTYVLYLSTLFSKKRNFFLFFLISFVVLFLIMLEPDLGTAVIIISSGLALFFVSGASITSLLAILSTGLLSILLLIFSSDYRRQRFFTFFNSNKDPLGASYHIRQILIALGSGGLFGLGLGRSRQKYEFLPEVTTDSIFAIIAEELGFIGGALVIITFMILLYRGFKIARNAPNEYSRLLATGIISWITIQAFINLGAMVSIVPLTGVPLPFISYGGSSLVIALVSIGILINISKHSLKD
jgi:cell division protein FtsW